MAVADANDECLCRRRSRCLSLSLLFMSLFDHQCPDAHGGALVNLIHGYTDNGDPFVRRFTDQLLEEVNERLCW